LPIYPKSNNDFEHGNFQRNSAVSPQIAKMLKLEKSLKVKMFGELLFLWLKGLNSASVMLEGEEVVVELLLSCFLLHQQDLFQHVTAKVNPMLTMFPQCSQHKVENTEARTNAWGSALTHPSPQEGRL